MTEQLKTCTGCETCWLEAKLAAVGADFDNGVLTRSAASEKISRASQEAFDKGCPNPKIRTFRDTLSRTNSHFKKYRALDITHSPTTIVDLYDRDQKRALSDSLNHMRSFKRGRRTLGRS
jgi:hypothetical protein